MIFLQKLFIFTCKQREEMATSGVDVSDIDRKVLLKALWENAKPAAFFNPIPSLVPPYDENRALEEVDRDGYVDYACGRCIKSDVFGKSNIIDPSLYDRDWGNGAFQNVVDKLRKQ